MLLRRRTTWVRAGAVVLGIAALAGGIVALFATSNGAASVLLITLGVLVVLGSLGTAIELESFEVLGAKLKVRQIVKNRLELAGSTPEADPAGSRDLLRRQASTLQHLNSLYGLYEYGVPTTSLRNPTLSVSRRWAVGPNRNVGRPHS